MSAARSEATRRRVLRLVATAAAAPLGARLLFTPSAKASALPSVEIWKSPTCGCCARWVQYMRQAGFSLTVHETDDMAAIKDARGVPDDLRACHTAIVNGYVIEGHVPAADVLRLINERPPARGMAVPGMPPASPGMDQAGPSYLVILFGTPAGNRIYAHHTRVAMEMETNHVT